MNPEPDESTKDHIGDSLLFRPALLDEKEAPVETSRLMSGHGVSRILRRIALVALACVILMAILDIFFGRPGTVHPSPDNQRMLDSNRAPWLRVP